MRLFSHAGLTAVMLRDGAVYLGQPGGAALPGHAVTLTADQWRTLREYFSRDCSVECESDRRDRPIPDNWVWLTPDTGGAKE